MELVQILQKGQTIETGRNLRRGGGVYYINTLTLAWPLNRSHGVAPRAKKSSRAKNICSKEFMDETMKKKFRNDITGADSYLHPSILLQEL